jgi:hypothetical protein
MQMTRNSLKTNAGPSDWFTGTVYIDPIAAPSPPSQDRRSQRPLHPGCPHGVAHPSARSDDLRHRGHRPLPARGGPVEEIRPGDRVFFEPGENHWHGAAPDRFMTHIAIQEADRGYKRG